MASTKWSGHPHFSLTLITQVFLSELDCKVGSGLRAGTAPIMAPSRRLVVIFVLGAMLLTFVGIVQFAFWFASSSTGAAGDATRTSPKQRLADRLNRTRHRLVNPPLPVLAEHAEHAAGAIPSGDVVVTATDSAPQPTTPTGATQCPTLSARGHWTVNTTHPGLEKERTWATTEGEHLAGHFNTSESGCQYTMLTSNQIRECLRGQTIVVFGDSLVRNMLNTLLSFIYPDFPMPHKIHEDWYKTPSEEYKTNFVFLWRPLVTYPVHYPSHLNEADHVLYGVGVWEMGSGEHHSVAGSTFKDAMLRTLERIGRGGLNPKRTRIFYTLHNSTREQRHPCYTPRRVHAMRDAAQCALTESHQPWSILDYLDATTTSAVEHFDRDWTHIKGTLLEGVVHMWINGMCGYSTGPKPTCTPEQQSWRNLEPCNRANPT
jgi:hypothetical protein